MISQTSSPSIRKSWLLLALIAVVLAAIGLGIWIWQSTPGAGVLASFTENNVQVEIRLERPADGPAVLKATFTPLEAGFHLYSKDLPPAGVDGVGRPTRLALEPGSSLKPAGALLESVPAAADPSSTGSAPLLVYPPGPVTLSLPVTLPPGAGMETRLSVTYMACSPQGVCHPPVIAKIVSVKIPTQ